MRELGGGVIEISDMVVNSLEIAQLTGQNEEHVVDLAELRCRVHASIVQPLLALREAALCEGFQLAVASGYRSYSRQCQLWNEKVLGQRSVVDDNGEPVDLAALDEWHKIQAILRWSALPGASRHHWGTEVDIYDAGAMPAGYQLQLVVAETQADGIFGEFHRWLGECLAGPTSFGFFRPYAIDTGGVAPEPWHLSYAPLARRYQATVTQAVIAQMLQQSTLLLKDVVLQHLDEIYQRYMVVADRYYPATTS